MKKVFVLFIMMFAMLGFVACNSGGSELDINYDEQIAFPTNLTIDGEILRWDVVENASGYYVYVDGEEVDSVRSNEFNFSNLEGTRLIFTVVTKAPRGMQDSVQSASIAHMENKTAEINSMKLAVTASGMGFPEEFAEELVNKGMLASEYEDMADAMEQFSIDMEDVQSVEDFYAALKDMMDNVENPEAMISALVKYVLPEQLDVQIMDLEYEIEEYQELIDNGYDYYGNYQERIDDLNDQILAIEELKDMIEDSADNVVKSILFVAEYVMSVEEMLTDTLIQNINNLTETDSLEDLNVSEMVLIKEEMVNILNETMPSVADITLVINTIYSFSSVLEDMEGISLGTITYPEKSAATLLMSFEAYIRFIDNLDEAFFLELKAIGEANYSSQRSEAEVGILMITYFDNFLEENETLFDEIDAVFTDEEKEEMFNQYMDSLDDLMGDTNDFGMVAIYDLIDLSFLTFDKMMTLKVIFEDAFNELLDAFVESEGQILLLIAEMEEYSDEFYDGPYESRDYDEYSFNNTLYSSKIADQIVYLMNSVIKERSQEEFEEVRGFLVDYAGLVFPFMMMNTRDALDDDTSDMLDVIETFINNTSDEQYDLIKSLASYLDKEDIFLDYANLYQETYEDNLEDLEDSNYFDIIFVLSVYDDYMTSGIRSDLDAVIAELVVLFATTEFEDVDFNANNFTDLLDYLDEVAPEVADFVYANMPASQTDRLDEILTEIEDIMS